MAAEIERDAGVTARVLPKDLRAEDAPSEIFSEMEADGVDVAVLVNNAGTCVYDEFCESDLRDEIEMLQVNVIALTSLTRLFLTKMLARRSGRILNLASGASFGAVPLIAGYAATKAYVLSLSESLAFELRGTGVSVTCPCSMAHREWDPGVLQGWAPRGRTRGKLADPAEVARAGVAACKRWDPIVIPGRGNQVLVFAMRLAPRKLNTRIAAWMFERV